MVTDYRHLQHQRTHKCNASKEDPFKEEDKGKAYGSLISDSSPTEQNILIVTDCYFTSTSGVTIVAR